MNKLDVLSTTVLAFFVLSACGGPSSPTAHDDSSAVASSDPYIPPTTPTSPTFGIWDDDPPFEVRINHDADALTREVLPALSDDYGLDRMELDDETLASDTAPSGVTVLLACHSSSSRWELNLNDTVVRAAIRPTSIVARFDSGRRVLTDLDMPSFSVEAELQFFWPKNVSSWYCNTFGSNYDFRVNVNVVGAAGSLDATLAEGPGIAIASIDTFSIDVDSVTFDSSLLTSITNLGLTVADLFGTGCSDMTSCVNDAIDDELTNDPDLKNALRDAINEALADAGTLEGSVDFGVAELDYAVGLTSITTNDSKDRLRTKWDVDFSTSAPDASCAAGLLRTHYLPVNDVQTNDDLELVVPFKKVSDVLYTVAKQGDLCAPFLYVSRGTAVTVDVKPNGAFQVTPTGGNDVSLSIPVKVEAALSAYATSAITGTLTITAEIEPTCGAGFQITPVHTSLDGLTGTMTYKTPLGTTITMSASTFITTYKGPAEAAIQSAISPGLSLVPSSFGLADVSKWVSIGDVVYDSSAMTIGLNLLDVDPYCP